MAVTGERGAAGAPRRPIFEDEPLPEGERILWEGSPSVKRLVFDVFHLRGVFVYFGLIALWAGWEAGWTAALPARLAWIVILAGVVAGLVVFYAGAIARSTRYLVTDRRVVLRFGVALPGVLNIPLPEIESAFVRRRSEGSGDLVIDAGPMEEIGFWLLWPHAKPWSISRARPMLRALDDVDTPGRVLLDATAAAAEAEGTRRVEEGACPPGWTEGERGLAAASSGTDRPSSGRPSRRFERAPRLSAGGRTG